MTDTDRKTGLAWLADQVRNVKTVLASGLALLAFLLLLVTWFGVQSALPQRMTAVEHSIDTLQKAVLDSFRVIRSAGIVRDMKLDTLLRRTDVSNRWTCMQINDAKVKALIEECRNLRR